jgi:hypothetical protein
MCESALIQCLQHILIRDEDFFVLTWFVITKTISNAISPRSSYYPTMQPLVRPRAVTFGQAITRIDRLWVFYRC